MDEGARHKGAELCADKVFIKQERLVAVTGTKLLVSSQELLLFTHTGRTGTNTVGQWDTSYTTLFAFWFMHLLIYLLTQHDGEGELQSGNMDRCPALGGCWDLSGAWWQSRRRAGKGKTLRQQPAADAIASHLFMGTYEPWRTSKIQWWWVRAGRVGFPGDLDEDMGHKRKHLLSWLYLYSFAYEAWENLNFRMLLQIKYDLFAPKLKLRLGQQCNTDGRYWALRGD